MDEQRITREYLCRQCGAIANFSVRLEVGTPNLRAEGSCENNHSWTRTWQVGQEPPAFPLRIGTYCEKKR